jgi:hypothetical protein
MVAVEEAEVTCARCGADFQLRRPGQLYCSERCQRRAGGSRTRRRRRTGQTAAIPERESCCRECGGELPSMRLLYCSERCRERFGSKRRKPPLGPTNLDTPVPCIGCGTLFTRMTYAHHFCSIECRPSWAPPKPRPVRPPPPPPPRCVTCGTPFVKRGFRGYRNTCSYRCELDRLNAKVAEQRKNPEWRAHDRAMRARRQQEEDAIFGAVRELGWLGDLLEAIK